MIYNIRRPTIQDIQTCTSTKWRHGHLDSLTKVEFQNVLMAKIMILLIIFSLPPFPNFNAYDLRYDITLRVACIMLVHKNTYVWQNWINQTKTKQFCVVLIYKKEPIRLDKLTFIHHVSIECTMNCMLRTACMYALVLIKFL